MAIKTYTEQLEEVQTEISKILIGGQEYAAMNRRIVRARLETLREYETELRKKVARETRGGIGVQYVNPER